MVRRRRSRPLAGGAAAGLVETPTIYACIRFIAAIPKCPRGFSGAATRRDPGSVSQILGSREKTKQKITPLLSLRSTRRKMFLCLAATVGKKWRRI